MDQDVIAELKAKHGRIFLANDGREEFILRPLKVGEFEKISSSNMSSAEAEEYAASVAVLWPSNPKFKRAGTVSVLAATILDNSTFTNPKEAKSVFAECRENASDVINVMKSVVLACYDVFQLTEKDLNEFTFRELAAKVAMAEQIIKVKKSIYDPNMELQLEIIDPEEISAADRAAQEAEFERLRKMGDKDPDLKSNFGAARVDDPIAQKLRAAMGK